MNTPVQVFQGQVAGSITPLEGGDVEISCKPTRHEDAWIRALAKRFEFTVDTNGVPWADQVMAFSSALAGREVTYTVRRKP